MTTIRLRWKRQPPAIGLARVQAMPRMHYYWDGTLRLATVAPNGGGYSTRQDGWYFYAHAAGQRINSLPETFAKLEDAKKAAQEWVKAAMAGCHTSGQKSQPVNQEDEE